VKNLTIRKIDDDDMLEISEWFSSRKWPVPPSGKMLPESGYVAVRDGKLLSVAWLYITNSQVGIVDWIATNPSAGPHGLISVTRLIDYIEDLSKGYINVFMHFTPNHKLAKFLKRKCGFKIAETDVNICIRRRRHLEAVANGE
jgi:hypothetical protein